MDRRRLPASSHRHHVHLLISSAANDRPAVDAYVQIGRAARGNEPARPPVSILSSKEASVLVAGSSLPSCLTVHRTTSVLGTAPLDGCSVEDRAVVEVRGAQCCSPPEKWPAGQEFLWHACSWHTTVVDYEDRGAGDQNP